MVNITILNENELNMYNGLYNMDFEQEKVWLSFDGKYEIKEKWERKGRRGVSTGKWCIKDDTNICQIYSEKIDSNSCPHDTQKWFNTNGKHLNILIDCEQEKPNDVKLSQLYCHRNTFDYAYIGMILSWVYFIGILAGCGAYCQ